MERALRIERVLDGGEEMQDGTLPTTTGESVSESAAGGVSVCEECLFFSAMRSCVTSDAIRHVNIHFNLGLVVI